MPKSIKKTVVLVLVLSLVGDPLTASNLFLPSSPRLRQAEGAQSLFQYQALGRALDWTRRDLFQKPTHAFLVRQELAPVTAASRNTKAPASISALSIRKALFAIQDILRFAGFSPNLYRAIQRFALRRGLVFVAGGANEQNEDAAEIPTTPHNDAGGSLQEPRNPSETRRNVVDDLHKRLVEGHESFWDTVYPLYMEREITRGDVRVIIHRGLEQARGNYKDVTRLFNMEPHDYKRFLNFLRKHGLLLPFREYREAPGPSIDLAVTPRNEVDDLYRRLVEGHESFWDTVYVSYKDREITRGDVREIIHRGLEQARGNNMIVVRLFNIDPRDYKRFLNFLRKHNLQLPFREFREASSPSVAEELGVSLSLEGDGNRAASPNNKVDDLHKRLVEGHESFWDTVYPLYMDREITRGDVREIIHRGLEQARGNYKNVTRLFNMDPRDYTRFLNFLRKHDLQLPFKEYREAPSPSIDLAVNPRNQVDDLYKRLVKGHESFWDTVYVSYKDREITRGDVREIIQRGLEITRGHYRMLVRLFNIDPRDYKRFQNFLRKNNLLLPFKEFRKMPAFLVAHVRQHIKTAMATFETLHSTPAPPVAAADTPEQLALLEAVNNRQIELSLYSKAMLLRASEDLRKRRQGGSPLKAEEAVEGLAIFAEAATRTPTVGLPTREQLLASLTMLLDGPVAIEQQTGEGKTLSIAGAAYVMALEGKGVHVHTYNRYLANRDKLWMEKVYEKLGTSSGILVGGNGKDDYLLHRDAHRKDITYGDADDFISDYLEDELDVTGVRQRQRAELPAAIFLDEADPRLLDEAEDPVILSSPSGQRLSPDYFRSIYRLMGRLESSDYSLNRAMKSAELTVAGRIKLLETAANKGWGLPEQDLIEYAQEALAARHLYARDLDYVILNNKIYLINGTTHRLKEGAVWEGQMNNFIAVKEQEEGIPVAFIPTPLAHNLITKLDYFSIRRSRLRAVSGTMAEAADELWANYGLSVKIVPRSNLPKREDYPLRLFATKAQKHEAIEHLVRELNEKAWPVLTISPSIAGAKYYYQALRPSIASANLLTVFEESQEDKILAVAGQPGALTDATPMAGRGTDIRLRSFDRSSAIKPRLVVIGTSPPANLRGERQLRGRAGRWTDLGVSYLFGSLDDELFQDFLSPEELKHLRVLGDQTGEVPTDAAQRALEKARQASEALRQLSRQETRDRGNLLTAHRQRFFEQIASHAKSRAAMLELHALWLDYLTNIQIMRRRLNARDYIAQTSQLYDDIVLIAEGIVGVELAQEREHAALARRFDAVRPRLTALVNRGWENDDIALATASENFPAPLAEATIRGLLSNRLPDHGGVINQLEASLPAMEAPGALTAFRTKRRGTEERQRHESYLKRLLDVQTRLKALIHNGWTPADIANETITNRYPQALSPMRIRNILEGKSSNEIALAQLQTALPGIESRQSPAAIREVRRLAFEQRTNEIRAKMQEYATQGWEAADISPLTATNAAPRACTASYITNFIRGASPSDPRVLDQLDSTLRLMEGREAPATARERTRTAHVQRTASVRGRLQAMIEAGWEISEIVLEMNPTSLNGSKYKTIENLLSGKIPRDPSVLDRVEASLPGIEGRPSPSQVQETERQIRAERASGISAQLRALVDRGWKPMEIAQECVTLRYPTPLPYRNVALIIDGNIPNKNAILDQLADALPHLEQREVPAQVRAALAERMRAERERARTERVQRRSRSIATPDSPAEKDGDASREAAINEQLEARRTLQIRVDLIQHQVKELETVGWTRADIRASLAPSSKSPDGFAQTFHHIMRGHIPKDNAILDYLETSLPELARKEPPAIAREADRRATEAAAALERAEQEEARQTERTAIAARTARVRAELLGLRDKGWTTAEIAEFTLTDEYKESLSGYQIAPILRGRLPSDPGVLDQLEAALPPLRDQVSPLQALAAERLNRRQAVEENLQEQLREREDRVQRRAERDQAAVTARGRLAARTAPVRSQLEAMRDRGWRPGEIAKAAVTEAFQLPLSHVTIGWILKGRLPGDPTMLDQLEAALPRLEEQEPPSRINGAPRESEAALRAAQRQAASEAHDNLSRRTGAIRAQLEALQNLGWKPSEISEAAVTKILRQPIHFRTITWMLKGSIPGDPTVIDQLEASLPALEGRESPSRIREKSESAEREKRQQARREQAAESLRQQHEEQAQAREQARKQRLLMEKQQRAAFAQRVLPVKRVIDRYMAMGWKIPEMASHMLTTRFKRSRLSRVMNHIHRGHLPSDPAIADHLKAKLPALAGIDREQVARDKALAEERARQVLTKRTAAVRSKLMRLAKRGWTEGDIAMLAKTKKYPRPLQHMTIWHIMAGHLPRNTATLDQLEAAMPELKRYGSRDLPTKAALNQIIAKADFWLKKLRGDEGIGQAEVIPVIFGCLAAITLLLPFLRSSGNSIIGPSLALGSLLLMILGTSFTGNNIRGMIYTLRAA